jgi:hypothetical protein
VVEHDRMDEWVRYLADELERLKRESVRSAAIADSATVRKGAGTLVSPVRAETSLVNAALPQTEPTIPSVRPTQAAISESAETPAPEYSLSFVRHLFEEFIRTGRAPRCPPTVELARLVYGRADAAPEIGAPARHVLIDTPRGGEFLRFSRPAATEALVFPNPEAHYVGVMRDLFPTLAREDYNNPAVLGAVEPVQVRRRADSQWEVG